LERIAEMSDGEDAERQLAIKLPRMSFEVISIQYDPSRQLPKMNYFYRGGEPSDLSKQLKYYLELDNVLYENFLNKVVTYQDIIDCLQNNYDELYNDTFGYTKKICIALD